MRAIATADSAEHARRAAGRASRRQEARRALPLGVPGRVAAVARHQPRRQARLRPARDARARPRRAIRPAGGQRHLPERRPRRLPAGRSAAARRRRRAQADGAAPPASDPARRTGDRPPPTSTASWRNWRTALANPSGCSPASRPSTAGRGWSGCEWKRPGGRSRTCSRSEPGSEAKREHDSSTAGAPRGPLARRFCPDVGSPFAGMPLRALPDDATEDPTALALRLRARHARALGPLRRRRPASLIRRRRGRRRREHVAAARARRGPRATCRIRRRHALRTGAAA